MDLLGGSGESYRARSPALRRPASSDDRIRSGTNGRSRWSCQKPGGDVNAKQVIEHCAKQFAKWQLPDDVLFVDTIPLTSTGKMDKKTVRAHLDSRGYELPDLRGKAG